MVRPPGTKRSWKNFVVEKETYTAYGHMRDKYPTTAQRIVSGTISYSLAMNDVIDTKTFWLRTNFEAQTACTNAVRTDNETKSPK